MPTIQDVERYRELLKHKWNCDQCIDGMPHKGVPVKHSRAAQRVGDAYITFFCTGRGWGKTRAAVEFVVSRMMSEPKHRVTVVAPTFGGGRDIVVEGESGILNSLPAGYVTNWNRSLGELSLRNGSMLKIFGSHTKEDSDAIRGSQSHTVLFEELAHHRHAQQSWDMAVMANRLGTDPRIIITATPRNTPLIRKLFNDPNVDRRTGSTMDNAENLAQPFVDYLLEKYQGTRLGIQELEGLLLEDTVGALWTRDMFHYIPAEKVDTETLDKIVISVDPPGSHRTKGSAEAGITVSGKRGEFVYVLEDLSQIASPEQWSQIAIEAYEKYAADAIVAEKNFGGDLVISTLRGAGFQGNVVAVTASRGKAVRAEPVVSLFERNKVTMVGSETDFEKLTGQLCSWIPPGGTEADENGVETPIEPSTFSPDRLDSLVHGITHLALQPRRSNTKMTCPKSMIRSY